MCNFGLNYYCTGLRGLKDSAFVDKLLDKASTRLNHKANRVRARAYCFQVRKGHYSWQEGYSVNQKVGQTVLELR